MTGNHTHGYFPVTQREGVVSLRLGGMQDDPAFGGGFALGQAVQGGVHGGDGHLALVVAGLAGGEALHLQAGPAQGAGEGRFGVGQGFQGLVADARHAGHN